MIDIILFDKEKGDSLIVNTDVYKACNLLKIQTGSLIYAADFGIDLNYFLNPAFEIENDVFINYLQQRISEFSMNIGDLKRVVEDFTTKVLITINSNEATVSKTASKITGVG